MIPHQVVKQLFACLLKVVIMLNQESTDHILNFHFIIFDLIFLNKLLINPLVTFEHFLLQFLVLHKMFSGNIAFSF